MTKGVILFQGERPRAEGPGDLARPDRVPQREEGRRVGQGQDLKLLPRPPRPGESLFFDPIIQSVFVIINLKEFRFQISKITFLVNPFQNQRKIGYTLRLFYKGQLIRDSLGKIETLIRI